MSRILLSKFCFADRCVVSSILMWCETFVTLRYTHSHHLRRLSRREGVEPDGTDGSRDDNYLWWWSNHYIYICAHVSGRKDSILIEKQWWRQLFEKNLAQSKLMKEAPVSNFCCFVDILWQEKSKRRYFGVKSVVCIINYFAMLETELLICRPRERHKCCTSLCHYNPKTYRWHTTLSSYTSCIFFTC